MTEAEKCAEKIRQDWLDQVQADYEPDVVWIAKTVQHSISAELARVQEQNGRLKDALQEMADAVEAEIASAKAEGISYGEIPAWLIKARNALAETKP